MNIDLILQQLDALFAKHKIELVEPFLLQKIEEAQQMGDTSSVITLMKELIGHYRETGEFDKSIACCRQVLELLERLGLKGSTAYATTLLNVANACRAAGLLRESMIYYNEVKKITILDPNMLNTLWKHKIDKEYSKLLKLIYSLVSNDDTTSTDVLIAYTEIERIKEYLLTLKNKGLKKELLDKYLKKLYILELELKKIHVMELTEEIGKGR